MDKYRLYQHFGSMRQLAYIRSVEFQERKKRQPEGVAGKNNSSQYLVMADKPGYQSGSGNEYKLQLSKPGFTMEPLRRMEKGAA